MIKRYTNTKIYVYCPSKVVTGGAELLHQLVHTLNNFSCDAYITYFDGGTEVPEAYRNYNIKIDNTPHDSKEHIVVLYEAEFSRVHHYRHAQIMLWWLSVDNLYYNSKSYLSFFDYFVWKPAMVFDVLKYRFGHLLLRGNNFFKNNVSIKQLAGIADLSCYQSTYAQHFLLSKGYSEILPLSDYINTDFIRETNKESIEKENIILYNPKKGFEHTRKLMKLAPHLKWIALEGMNRQQLKEVFTRSKLYIDFGFHPGKDRLPREAALNNCCIISGRFGSAKFFEDVAISDEYKMDLNIHSYKAVVEKIEDVLLHYDKCIHDFSFYKKRILDEEQKFVNQVKDIFQIEAA